jgi:hypothetical protein
MCWQTLLLSVINSTAAKASNDIIRLVQIEGSRFKSHFKPDIGALLLELVEDNNMLFSRYIPKNITFL